MRLRFTLPTLGVAAMIVASPAQAQCSIDAPPAPGASCTAPLTVEAFVNAVASLDIGSLTTALIVTAADYAAGVNLSPGPFLTVGANTAWTLAVHSTAATWNGPAGTTKPNSDLKVDVGGPQVTVSTTAQTLASGNAQPSNLLPPSNLVSTWSYLTDPPGVYSLTLVFTLTAP